MNELRAKNINGKEVIDSRDVAAMIDKSHRHLLETIRKYISYMEDRAEGEFDHGTPKPNFRLGDFFIESAYLDSNGQERPNYLITKMGCEMIANKMTGRKGVLFTAAYVSAFNAMRGALVSATAYEKPTMAIVREMELRAKTMEKMGCSAFEIAGMMTSMDKAYNIPVPAVFANKVDPQMCLFSGDAPMLTA